MKTALLGVILTAAPLFAQSDPGMATQMAMDQAQMANQQAMDQAQLANQQAMDQANAVTDSALNEPAGLPCTRQPVFSIKSGVVVAGATVRIKSPTHYATIFYTVNGWTPTPDSRRYEGPITIRANTVLQAIAVAPNMAPSVITRAQFTIAGAPPSAATPPPVDVDGVLLAGTRLHLVTAQQVSSRSADVGDRIQLKLDQDITMDGHVVAPRGTPVVARITQADAAAHAGTPGDIAFEVRSIRVGNFMVPITGGETLEGPNHYTRTKALVMIPAAGLAGLLMKGDEAVIRPGMHLTVTVAADSPLKPMASAQQ